MTRRSNTRVDVLILLCITFMTCSVHAFNLTILHTNDFHARIEQTNKYSGPCSTESAQNGECYGGSARIKTMADQKRAENPNTILLDAGDQFQGTLWYYKFGGAKMATFMNLIGYDAMAIGNHEFDNGVSGLVPFASNVRFPLLSSNMDLSNTPSLQNRILKSTVVNVNNLSVGIVGYTTVDTSYLSSPETVTFTDVLAAVQAEVNTLISQGIKFIIALGHAGFDMDKKVAAEVNGVDIVIGGHTNTFLYNGAKPSNENPEGPYPFEVTNKHSGKPVLVVQDYAYAKYLGYLNVIVDDQGVVTQWSGNPILLDNSVAQDTDVAAEINKDLVELNAFRQVVIGKSHVLFDNSGCRAGECNLGNLVADAMVRDNLRHSDGAAWSDVAIAVINGGGLRSTITKGDITLEAVLQVLPFRNTIDIVEVKGTIVWQMLEHGISKLDQNFGGFLQVSGIQVTFDKEKPVGQRVQDVQVVCTRCDVPKMERLKMNSNYKILMSTFISNGGDDYSFIPTNTISKHLVGTLMSDTLLEYLNHSSPVYLGLQGRIRFTDDVDSWCSRSGSEGPAALSKLFAGLVMTLFWLN